jgi:hypothetical protein
MKFPRIFENIAVLAPVILSLLATPAATAQTVLSNETLVSTTLVVNTQTRFGKPGCRTKTPMFAAIQVACPAPIGQTCTFHISLDAKVSLSNGWTTFYQFLVDGAAPRSGPPTATVSTFFKRMSSELRACPSAKAIPLLSSQL